MINGEIIRVAQLNVSRTGNFVAFTVVTAHSMTVLNADEVRALRDALTRTLRQLEKK